MRTWPVTITQAEDEYARSVGFASGAERREAIRRDEERKLRREQQLKADSARVQQPDAERHALKERGVTAREERVYTAEEMRAARVALGIEPPDPAVALAVNQ
jgi:hypothetical protein